MNKRAGLFTLVVAISLMATPTFAVAGTAEVTGLLQQFSSTTNNSSWVNNSLSYGRDIFALLAAIEFSWTWILWLLEKGGGEDDPIPYLIRKILGLGFFYALLLNGPLWISDIIRGFIYLGAQIGGVPANTQSVEIANNLTNVASPGWILSQGVDIAQALAKAAQAHMSITSPVSSTFIAFAVDISMLVVVAAFALIAGQLIIALVEAFIIVGAGIFFLGFGGSRWTLPFAEKYIGYAMSIGIKLFMVYIVIAVGSSLSTQWIAEAALVGSNVSLYYMVALEAVIYALLAWKIPEFASTLMNGTPQASLGGAIGTVAGLAGAAVGVAGAGIGVAAGAAGAALGAGKGLVGAGMSGAQMMGEVGGHLAAARESGAGVMAGLGDVGAVAGSNLTGAIRDSVPSLGNRGGPTSLGQGLQQKAAERGWNNPPGSSGAGGGMGEQATGADSAAQNAGNNAATGQSDQANTQAAQNGGASANTGTTDGPAPSDGGNAGQGGGTGTEGLGGGMGEQATGADSAAQNAGNNAATGQSDQANTQAAQNGGASANTGTTDGPAPSDGNAQAERAQDITNTKDTGKPPKYYRKTSLERLQEGVNSLPPDQGSTGGITIRFDHE
jgi:type IV secretion system protein TrbL